MKLTKEQLGNLVNAKASYDYAASNYIARNRAKEQIQNLLLNYLDSILDSIKEEQSLQEEILNLKEENAALQTALAEADKENDALRKKKKGVSE